MRNLHAFVVVSALSTLACTGLLGEGEDTAVAAGDTGGSTGPEDGVHQTSSCADYLACLESADPDEYDDVKGKYDEDGSCWQSTREKMQDCDAECETAYNDLIESEGSGVCDSPEDTGDTGGGGGGGCALDAGSYGSEWSIYEYTCGLEGYLPTNIEVECSGQNMTITVDLLGIPLPCTSDGRDFTCEQSGDFYVGIGGRASSDGTSADSTMQVDAGCYSLADVYLYKD